MSLAHTIDVELVLLLVAAWSGGVCLGRHLRHRDRVRLQIHRILEWYS